MTKDKAMQAIVFTVNMLSFISHQVSAGKMKNEVAYPMKRADQSVPMPS